MNRRGQIDNPIILFAILVIGLLIIAPIMLKVMREVQAPVSNALGNLTGAGGQIAQSNFNAVIMTGINFWDEVVMYVFILSLLLLIISAWFTATHPGFIILYVFLCFMLILFAPNIIQAVDNIYTASQFQTEVTMLPLMNAIRTNYAEILIGVMILTGIIIYGRLSITRKGGL